MPWRNRVKQIEAAEVAARQAADERAAALERLRQVRRQSALVERMAPRLAADPDELARRVLEAFRP